VLPAYWICIAFFGQFVHFVAAHYLAHPRADDSFHFIPLITPFQFQLIRIPLPPPASFLPNPNSIHFMPTIPKNIPARLSLAVLLLAAASALRAQAPDSVFLEDYTSPELRAAVAGGTTSVLVFSGGMEETGAHVALGKHNFRARAYAERIARQLGHTLVAPIIPAAPAPAPLALFPGTLNIAPAVYSAYVAEIARSLANAGFTRIFLLTDHGGSMASLKELAPKLDAEFAPRGARLFLVTDNYDKSTAEIEALAKQRGWIGPGHGGLWDVAELWAVAPAAVRPKLFASFGTDPEQMKTRGVTGDPTPATPELGREFGAIRVENGVKQIRALLAAEPPVPSAPNAK
jgi:creatinine amidohydrolase